MKQILTNRHSFSNRIDPRYMERRLLPIEETSALELALTLLIDLVGYIMKCRTRSEPFLSQYYDGANEVHPGFGGPCMIYLMKSKTFAGHFYRVCRQELP